MSRQKHHPGNKKRNAREAVTPAPNQRAQLRDLARDLVARGLASPLILSDTGARRPDDQPHPTERSAA